MRRIAPVLVVAALLTHVPPAGAARWSEPHAIETEVPSFGPAADLNARGDALIAWTGGDRVWASFAPRGRGFSKPVAIEGAPGGSELKVALDDRGNATVGWLHFDRSVVGDPEERFPAEDCCQRFAGAVRPAGRRAFGKARILSRGGSDVGSFDLDAGHSGGGFLWSDSRGLTAAFGTARGEVEPSRQVGPRGVLASLLIRRDGTASLVAGFGDGALVERVRGREGTVGPARTIARAGSDAFLTDRWADRGGNEFAEWSSEEAALWSTRPRGGSYASPRRMRAPKTYPPSYPQAIAMAPDGGVVTIWDDNTSVLSSFRKPGGVFGGLARVASVNGGTAFPEVSLGDGGRGMAAWSVSYYPEPGTDSVFARRLRGGKPEGSLKRLRLSPGSAAPAHGASVATSASGDALVAWWESPGRIAYARFE